LQAQFRGYAYLTLAQYDAATLASHGRLGSGGAAARGAVAGASAVVLTYLYPAEAPALEAIAQQQASAAAADADGFAAGNAIGRRVAATLVAHARTDRFDAVWTGTVPTGPGRWLTNGTPPIFPLLGGMLPFLMKDGSEFRPEAPPAFGSDEFLSALAEIRRFSDGRPLHPEQLALALYWQTGPGGNPATYWNGVARDLIAGHPGTERDAARALALMNMGIMDGDIACHDAKYTYWFIRPPQADPGITVPFAMPNHPSYPSAHACVSGAASEILAGLFPDEGPRLIGLGQDAAVSRLYAGIHYRFDMRAGLAIARRVARLALRVHGFHHLRGACAVDAAAGESCPDGGVADDR
jgi:hypothetical protein